MPILLKKSILLALCYVVLVNPIDSEGYLFAINDIGIYFYYDVYSFVLASLMLILANKPSPPLMFILVGAPPMVVDVFNMFA